MKEIKRKTVILELDHNICAGCYVRIGTGERHVVKARKSYHQNCFVKLEIAKAGRGRQR